MQLFIRHEEKKVRRAGGKTGSFSAFDDDDRERFVRNLSSLIHDALRNAAQTINSENNTVDVDGNDVTVD